MVRIHDITKRDFLVYVNGMGVYINVLFAERHGIREGSSIGRFTMKLHYKEVPPMDCTSSHIWLSDEQKEQGDEYFNLNPYTKVGTMDPFDPSQSGHMRYDSDLDEWVKYTIQKQLKVEPNKR